MNPRTGHVSPQYHVKHDDFFETVSTGKKTNFDTPKPDWKYLSKLLIKQQKKSRQQQSTTMPEGGNLLWPIRATTSSSQHWTTEAMDDQPQDQLNEPANLDPMPQHEGGIPAQQQPPVPTNDAPPPTQRQTRSGRVIRSTTRFEEGMQQREQGIVAWEVLVDQDEQEDAPTAEVQYELQKQLEHPMAFAASADPDTMYITEAMEQPDRAKFIVAMDKELDDHASRGHWKVVPRSKVPAGTRIVNMVWSMKRKRRIDTREVYRWKARLNVHGGQQQCGVNYWNAHTTIRFRVGFSASPCRSTTLHEFSSGLSLPARRLTQDTLSTAASKHIWHKTGPTSLVPLLGKGPKGIGIYAQSVGSLSILQRQCDLHGIHRRLYTDES